MTRRAKRGQAGVGADDAASRGRGRRLLLVTTAAATTVGLAAVAGAVLWPRARGGVGVADELWALELATPQDGRLRLADWRGQRVVINFWATWCAPCLEEMPMLDRFQLPGTGGLPVLGLAADRPEAVQRFLRRLPVRFPIGIMATGGLDLTRRLGNEQGGLPFSLLMGEDGRIAAFKTGQLHEDELRVWAQTRKTV